MAKKSILTGIVGVLSSPFIALSRIAEFYNLWNLRADIGRCLNVIDSSADVIPRRFIVALIAAEDRRSALHPGVDPIAMIRAGFVGLRQKQIEGASTIEQQFVRVVSGRYERSLWRKIKEQALAVAVSRRRSKSRIAAAYLSVAFYGSGCTGVAGLKKRCGSELEIAEQRTVLSMIARLKYPEPLQATKSWRLKIARRVRYIAERMAKAANKPLQPISQAGFARSLGRLNGDVTFHRS